MPAPAERLRQRPALHQGNPDLHDPERDHDGISFDGAIDGAVDLGMALSDAARKLADLEAGQARQLARAQIRRDYVNDPVGEAAALARDEFRGTLPEGVDLTPDQQADYQTREDAYAAEAAAIERLQQERAEAERAAAEAARGGAKGASDAVREAKKRQEAFTSLFDGSDLTAIERQIELIGKSNVESAALRAQWAMTDEAKRAGIPLNEELNEKIAQQAAEVGRLTGELERGQLQQEQFDQAIEGIAGTISGVLVQGQSLRDGLANIFRGIASDILSSGISNALKSMLGGAQGGGGGFLSAAVGFLGKGFGGFRAAGGPVSPDRAYVVGEQGPEIFTPASMGNIIPNHQLGGSSSPAPMVIEVNGATGNAEIREMVGIGISQGLAAYDKTMPDRVRQINARPRYK